MNRQLADGTARVVVSPVRRLNRDVMLLSIRVLQGEIREVAEALARRANIPFIDILEGGNDTHAVVVAEPHVVGRHLGDLLDIGVAV